MTNKTCFKCGETKDREDFYRHPMMADGRLGKCKECTKADVKAASAKAMQDPERLAKERARAREKAKQRYAAGLVVVDPEKRNAAMQRYRIRALLEGKTQARSRVANAVRSGKLVRVPCVVCGNPKSEAHHEDYTKPLEVVWLCRTHHGEVHRKC